MDYQSYIHNVRKHLEWYKNIVLGVHSNGTYRGHEYGHILTQEHGALNLGLPESEYTLSGSTLKLKGCPTLKLHMDWRHMNSSQILCISYFYDFISDKNKLQKLVSSSLNIDAKVVSAAFEYITQDGSNIDFVVNLENGGKVYFEIKYTESEFGPASSKNADYQMIRERYHSSIEINDTDYRRQYQLVRNVCLSPGNSNNHTVFLLPRANSSINTKYEKGIKSIRNVNEFHVQRLYWEDLIEQIHNETVFKKYFDLI